MLDKRLETPRLGTCHAWIAKICVSRIKRSELIVRWDSAPHHRQIKTFPNHKHSKEEVLESKEVEIEEILKELERMIKDKIL